MRYLAAATQFRTLAGLALLSTAALAGPPFQTDDPEPVDFRHYEFYTFAASDGTAVETDAVGPAFEFNWGPLPNVHLHLIAPLAAILPANNPALAPAGTGPRAVGLGDIELGIKYRFVQESKYCPMIGTFTMFELPSGSAVRGLGSARPGTSAPLGAEKLWPWTTYGGGGVTFVSAPGYRNFPYAGWLVQRDLGKKLTLGTEVFYHGPEGLATPQTRPATLVDLGGYYKFATPDFSYCSVTATPPSGKPRITPTSGCTGRGARMRSPPPARSIAWRRPASWGVSSAVALSQRGLQ